MTRPHGQDKDRSRANRAIINRVLMEQWDPIGMGEQCPADEYVGYANRAYAMMMYEDASLECVASYLYGIATKYIGLSDTPHELSVEAPRLILSHKAEFMATGQ